MREKNKQLGSRPVSVRIWTWKDKKSMFRVSEPDRHIVELHIGNCMVRDWSFDEAAKAVAQYDYVVNLFPKGA